MMIKAINNDIEYQEAVELLEEIGDNPNFERDEKLIKQFNTLLKFIKQYEERNFAVKVGDPIEIIKLKMNYLELKPKDLIPAIGSKGLVSEILNKRRRLSKTMIRKLSDFLKVDQEILNVEYSISPKREKSKKGSVEFSLSEQIYFQAIEFTSKVINRGLLFNVCPSR